MVGRIIFCLLFLLAISAYAAEPISPRRDSLRIAAFRQINAATTGSGKIDTAVGNMAINRAISRVCKKLPAIEKLDTIIVSRSAEGAALPSDCDRIKLVFKMKGDTLRLPLKLVPLDSDWTSSSTSENTQEKADVFSPRYYYTWGDRLLFHPKYIIATNADSFLVLYYSEGEKLTIDSSQTAIPDTYRELVILYACSILMAIREDYTAATWYENKFNQEVERLTKPREAEGKQ